MVRDYLTEVVVGLALLALAVIAALVIGIIALNKSSSACSQLNLLSRTAQSQIRTDDARLNSIPFYQKYSQMLVNKRVADKALLRKIKNSNC